MKGKKTIIISSLIMCLTLIVAIVSVTAAWFGNVTQQQLSADLTVGSGAADASANIELDSTGSGNPDENKLYPAKADPNYFLSDEGRKNNPPGNYGIFVSEKESTKLYPTKPPENNTGNPDLHLSREAKVATVYFTIEYIGPGDSNASDGKKSLLLTMEGVYLQSALTVEDDTYKGFEGAENYCNEFNVKMTLVDEAHEKTIESTQELVQQGGVYYDNTYSNVNKYGHQMKLRVQSSERYTVKFEIYFNKIDEECNADLLNTNLVMRITLNRSCNFVGSAPDSGN